MNQKIWAFLVFDFLVGLAFIASNLYIWDYFAGKITVNTWGPLQISIAPQTIVNGHATTIVLVFPMPNYPFILFWVALVGNFILAFLALRPANKSNCQK